MLDNIPKEMRVYRQWIVWKLVERENAKPTKIPYNALTGILGSVTNPFDWCSYEEACYAVLRGGYSGIGFVLTNNDPYSFIDLDDAHGDIESYQRQIKIYQEFDSYSERSPSKTGLHIIVKGSVPQGRRRSNIEVYSSERYMTMTGDVYNDRPIVDRNELLNILWNEMGGPVDHMIYGQDQVERYTDDHIIYMAKAATNGDKFSSLFDGEWTTLYPSQSEADYALIDILAFYTQNKAQIARIFRLSQLGQRGKANRSNYVNFMIEKSFDRQLPPIDIDGIRINGEKLRSQLAAVEPGGTTAANLASSILSQPPARERSSLQDDLVFPPGLVGETAEFLLAAAPRQVRLVALAGAIALIAGVSGRAYNVSGTGLNQYVLVIANTGAGKDAVASGISRLVSIIKPSVPSAVEFVGPGEIASNQGIVKWLSKFPSVVSVIGEFGMKLKEMSSERAPPHVAGVKRLLLQLYSKSGKGNVLDPTAYADRERNVNSIYSPALTIIGESTPERFFQVLDENMVADGLLPRFMILEYKGPIPYTSKTHADARPTFDLVEKLSALMAQCLSFQQSNNVCNVAFTDEAKAMFDKFDIQATDRVNNTEKEVTRQLWNRAHIKALKLAALVAVGINYINPVITKHETEYAISIVTLEIDSLIDRFASGEIGVPVNASDEHKQIKHLAAAVTTWMTLGDESYLKYKMTENMQRDGVFLWNALQVRLFSDPCFKNDRFGATVAVKKALQYFIDAGDIQELPKAQVLERYGVRAKSYCVVNMKRFAKGYKEG